MKVSLFYEFPLPRPWTQDDEHKLFQDGLDEVEAADKAGDQGTNDLVVSDVLRPNELQSWFIGQHLVEMPLVLEK